MALSSLDSLLRCANSELPVSFFFFFKRSWIKAKHEIKVEIYDLEYPKFYLMWVLEPVDYVQGH